MVKRTEEPDPATFPGQPRWATWLKNRNPQFKLHNTLGHCKIAIGGRNQPRGYRNREWPVEGGWVYEWVYDPDTDSGHWVEWIVIPPGTYLSDVPAWREKEHQRGPSQRAIDKAIASIHTALQGGNIDAQHDD